MSTREITAIRKEGRLDEAYEMCLKEFPNFQSLTNIYEIGAVGWILINLIDREIL